jgi:hypothetical protein
VKITPVRIDQNFMMGTDSPSELVYGRVLDAGSGSSVFEARMIIQVSFALKREIRLAAAI